MGHRIGSKRKEKTAPKPSLRDLFSESQTCPLLLTLLALAAPQAASSDVFYVTNAGDYAEHLKEAPRAGTFRDAIRRAQKKPNQQHTIVIKTTQPIQLKSSLPPISAEGLKIIGGGDKPAVIDGQNKYAAGAVSKNLNIANVTFQNFSTQGSSGGNGAAGGGGGAALGGFAYISPGTGTTTYSNTTFSNNSVQGGAGGDGTFNYTGSPAGSGKFVEGGGGGAGPNGAGGNGETANVIAEGSTNGGYGGGGGGGGGIPRGKSENSAPGGSTESFGGGGGASNHVSGQHVPPPINPSFPPNLANFIGAEGTSSETADRGGAGGHFVLNKNYEVSNGEHSAQGGGGGGSGSTSDKVAGSSHGGNSNSPTGVYTYGGGGGGGGGHSKTASGNGGTGGVYSGGGGGGSATASTSSGAGGAGGFGGGGGGSGPYSTAAAATAGFGGGQGAIVQTSEGLVYGGGGGGGAGLGGTFYLDSGTTPLEAVTVVLNDCRFSSNRAEGGKGGTNGIEQASSGHGLGQDVFMTAGSTLTVNMTNTNPTIDLWGDGGARAPGAASLSSGGLNVNGTGTLTLPAGPGNRNYSGTVTVGSGSTLAFHSDQDLGLASNPIHLNGGTLQSDNLTTARTITISGQGTFKNNAEFQATGLIQDGETPGKVTLSGTGDYRLKPSTANTYSGGTEISPGATVYPLSGDESFGAATGPITFLPNSSSDSVASIHVSKSGSSLNTARLTNILGNGQIVIDPSSSASFSGPITGTAQLEFEGKGTATISANSSTTYSGTLLNNIAQLNFSGDQPIGPSSTLEIGPSASQIGFASTNLPSVIHAANSVAMTATSGNSALTGSLSGSGAIQATSKEGKLAFTPTKNNTSYTGDISATALQSSGTNPFGVGDLTLNDSLEFVGSGTYKNRSVTLNGPVTLQTHTGTVSKFGPSTLIEGSALLTINGPGAVHVTSSDNTFSGQTQVNGATLGILGTNSLSNSPLHFDQGTLHLLDRGAIFSNDLYLANQSSLTIEADNGSTSTHAGIINGNNTTTIAYQGPGTLQLTGTNTPFSGTFDLQSGTLKTSGTNPIGVGTVILDGTNLVLTGDGAYANSWTANAPTTTITAQSGTSAFSGNINTSSGNIDFAGPGTVQLSGNNTDYTGLITVISGSLQVEDSSNLGGASIAMAKGELHLTGSSTFNQALAVRSALLNVGSSTNTWSGILSGSALHITGSDGGQLVLAGNNENYAGGFTVGNGVVLSAADQSQLGTGSIFLNGSTLNLSGSDTFTNNIALSSGLSTISLSGGSNAIIGAFTGYTPFELNGSGSLALTNGKGFKGAITLAGGTLQLSGINPIGPGQIRWNGGSLEVTGNSSFSNPVVFDLANSPILVGSGHTATFTGGLSGSGGLLFNSPDGTLVLSNNTYADGTSFEAGTIQTSGTNPLGTGTLKYSRRFLTVC